MLKQENVKYLKQANRMVKKDLGNLEQLKIVVYSDTSFSNLTDGGSQGGYTFFGWKQWQV